MKFICHNLFSQVYDLCSFVVHTLIRRLTGIEVGFIVKGH